MKKILYLSATILTLLFFSSVAFARHGNHPRPTPSPTPTPSVSPTPSPTPVGSGNLCINYGDQTATYNLTQVAVDLAILNTAKINCLRLSYMGWNNAQSEALAIFAQSKGFRVIVGGDWGTLTASQEASYQSQVLTEATWAQANKIPQMSLGNEQEYRLSGLTQTQWYTFLETLATKVKTVYSGQVSYETSGDFANFWATKPLGSIDLLGLNLYCGYGCNANYLQENITAHGATHMYVSETNADMSISQYGNDATHASEVTGDAVKLLNFGVPVYYFTFSTCNNSNGVQTNWGLYQCNVLAQPLTAKALGI